jgi:hypothetical protein
MGGPVMKRECLIVYLIICLHACNGKPDIKYQLFDQNNISAIFGSETESLKQSMSFYKSIQEYYVDYSNNVFIGDLEGKKIDKFNKYGEYMLSFGGPGQGPGEFSNSIPSFCADSKGTLYTSYLNAINVFNSGGALERSVKFPQDYQSWLALCLKTDHNDDLFVLLSTQLRQMELLKYKKDLSQVSIIHTERKRINTGNCPNATGLFLPDFDFDKENNIYVTDTVEYKVYVYSPQGRLIKTYFRDTDRNKIKNRDLVFPTLRGKEIVALPQTYLSGLTGNLLYLPSIFGISVDGDKIFIWTSNRDRECRFLIDIYDLNFNYLGKASFYNNLKKNLAFFRNGFSYSLNIGSEDISFKKMLGRLAFYNMPYKVLCYKYEL